MVTRLGRLQATCGLRRAAPEPPRAAAPPPPPSLLLWRQAAACAAASAVLGPLCDGLHGAHGVLRYAHPSLRLALPPGAAPADALWSLDTCWWVPLLFAGAGALLGVGHPLSDALAGAGEGPPRCGRAPSWPAVHAGVAAFVLQYYASAALEAPLLGAALPGGVPALDALLAAWAAAQWAALDGTRRGLLWAAATAVAGPAAEVALTHAGLYAYAHPAALGVPTWICWVYFGGAPAVGNLTRRVAADLARAAAAA